MTRPKRIALMAVTLAALGTGVAMTGGTSDRPQYEYAKLSVFWQTILPSPAGAVTLTWMRDGEKNSRTQDDWSYQTSVPDDFLAILSGDGAATAPGVAGEVEMLNILGGQGWQLLRTEHREWKDELLRNSKWQLTDEWLFMRQR